MKDLLVGAPYSSSGRVFAYSAATGTWLWDVGAGQTGDRFGLALAGFRDYDSDGVDDVLAGAPNAVTQTGKVYVLAGSDGAELDVLTGAQGNDRLGTSLALVGDVDGDSLPDVAIGAPGGDPRGMAEAGLVDLRSGADLSLLSHCNGPAAGAAFGTALALAGDVNSDGVPELVGGAELADGAGVSAPGSAHVLSCRTLALTTEDVLLSASSGGRARFDLDAGPDYGLRRYMILASGSGTWPGVDVGSVHVPLNGDLVTRYLFKPVTSPMFRHFRGFLSADGRAKATFDTLGALDRSFFGLKLHFAFILLPIDYASNAVPVEIVP